MELLRFSNTYGWKIKKKGKRKKKEEWEKNSPFFIGHNKHLRNSKHVTETAGDKPPDVASEFQDKSQNS